MPTVVVETSVCVMGLWPAFLKFSGKLSAISSIVIGSNKHLTTWPGSFTLCNFSLTISSVFSGDSNLNMADSHLRLRLVHKISISSP